MKPFRLSNWPAEDLALLGGPFATERYDPEVAIKQWLAMSADMPMDGERLQDAGSSKRHGPLAEAATGDAADRHINWQLPKGGSNGSMLNLHMEMNGGTSGTAKGESGWTTGYGVEHVTTDPNQLEVCRHCGKDLGFPRDELGYAIRSTGGQRQYCGSYCKTQQDNARDRRGRARKRARKQSHVSTGPQERFPTGEVIPWNVPYWAADPWLKFVRAGSVPIGRGRTISYADPVGEVASRKADEKPERQPYEQGHIADLADAA